MKSQNPFDRVLDEQNKLNENISHAIDEIFSSLTFTRTTLYCPMCVSKLNLTAPDNTYICSNCGAYFEMLFYGKKYEIE